MSCLEDLFPFGRNMLSHFSCVRLKRGVHPPENQHVPKRRAISKGKACLPVPLFFRGTFVCFLREYLETLKTNNFQHWLSPPKDSSQTSSGSLGENVTLATFDIGKRTLYVIFWDKSGLKRLMIWWKNGVSETAP